MEHGPSIAHAKKSLRQELWAARRAARAASTPQSRRAAGESVAKVALDLVRQVVPEAGTVTSYESWPVEPSTRALNEQLTTQGYRVIVPVTLPDLDLDWRDLGTDEGDEQARLGRDAIALADLVLLPGTAVDRHGVRLGQGGGCYDRALPRRRPGVLAATILHPHELVDTDLPQGDLDQVVDAAITAEGITWVGSHA